MDFCDIHLFKIEIVILQCCNQAIPSFQEKDSSWINTNNTRMFICLQVKSECHRKLLYHFWFLRKCCCFFCCFFLHIFLIAAYVEMWSQDADPIDPGMLVCTNLNLYNKSSAANIVAFLLLVYSIPSL